MIHGMSASKNGIPKKAFTRQHCKNSEAANACRKQLTRINRPNLSAKIHVRPTLRTALTLSLRLILSQRQVLARVIGSQMIWLNNPGSDVKTLASLADTTARCVCLDEGLMGRPSSISCERPVLADNVRVTPALNFPKTTNHDTSAMLGRDVRPEPEGRDDRKWKLTFPPTQRTRIGDVSGSLECALPRRQYYQLSWQ